MPNPIIMKNSCKTPKTEFHDNSSPLSCGNNQIFSESKDTLTSGEKQGLPSRSQFHDKNNPESLKNYKNEYDKSKCESNPHKGLRLNKNHYGIKNIDSNVETQRLHDSNESRPYDSPIIEKQSSAKKSAKIIKKKDNYLRRKFECKNH